MKQKRKYKNFKKLDKDTKKIIIAVVLLIMMIIIMNIVIHYLDKKQKQDVDQLTQYTSIQQIVEDYGCKFIKEENSKDKQYAKDIYLEFKYNTFEDNESQERYYKNVIGNVYFFLNSNVRLIDESKNLMIEVQKHENTYVYTINGVLDYFVKEASKKTLEDYETEKITNFTINSSILSNLVNDDWKGNINLENKDTVFENYEIYFHQGIEIRKISQKVYNLIFNTKYTDNVVNGIKPGTPIETIITKLGNPIYGTNESEVIGYKGKDIYVFFSENEISVYRNETVSTNAFEQLLDKYVNKQIDIKEFMNELTYLWDDYSEYIYDQNYINIRYPLKGIQIKMENDDSKNVEVYNNYSNTDKMRNFISAGKINGKLNENLVYIEECDRLAKKNDLLYICQLQAENNSIDTESNLFGYYLNNNKINFVSKDGNRPNETVTDNMNTGFWYTDAIFIYSIKGKGIYAYHLDNHTKTQLVEGNEDYTFEKYENNTLTYDKDKQIQIS